MNADSKPLPIIEVLNLKKRYGLIQALKGISFSVGKGEIAGFLGQMVPKKHHSKFFLVSSLPILEKRKYVG